MLFYRFHIINGSQLMSATAVILPFQKPKKASAKIEEEYQREIIRLEDLAFDFREENQKIKMLLQAEQLENLKRSRDQKFWLSILAASILVVTLLNVS